MKKIIFAFLIAIFTFSNVNAQKIEVKKFFGENLFYQNGEKLTMNQLKEVLKNNKETLDLIKSAKHNYTWSSVLGFSGGALIGIPIGTAIGGGDPKWEIAGLGATLILVAIPLLNNYNKKSKAAVDLYNVGLPTVSASFQPEFNLNFKGSSLGIVMNF
ncbi:hypothetical protein SAMN05216503_0147 [Polaribacter sp. KT25b]|uniref:hypothetical protein n=1 Tax=Polaribacter sp. KT25b TaxID=1855336 RepID=UPI00087CECB8|nr:hypothetical protein [Polaribacter sp. KT25b]SDR66315.1 hypothetical protein SAMN05216503_0147 [Polaribacter sp. KT25b]